MRPNKFILLGLAAIEKAILNLKKRL